MGFLLAALVSVLPAIVLLAAVWIWLFRGRRPGIFWTAFGFGIAATVFAILLQLPLLAFAKRALEGSGEPLAILLVSVALIEEALKVAAWYACYGIFRRPVRRDAGIAAGIGAVAALAFAAVENLLFNLGAAGMNHGHVNWDVALARGGATVPLHATSGLIIGIIAWRIHGSRRGRLGARVALIALPFLLHGGFNVMQAMSGAREGVNVNLSLHEWAWIGGAGVLVWIVAALAIRYYIRHRRDLRRRGEATA